MNLSREYAQVCAALLIVLLVSGCGGSSPQTLPPAVTTSLRVIQGNAGAGTVNVLIDGAAVSSSLPFPGNSGYLPVKPGSQLALQASGLAINPPPALTLNVPVNSSNTFILDGWGAFNYSTMLLADDTAPSANGNPKLRIVHGAWSSTMLDVYAAPSGTILPSGNPIVSNLSFDSASSYQVMPAGSYDLFFSFAVSAGGSPSTVLFHTGAISLAANQNRTLVLMNDCNPSTCQANTFRSMLLADLN